MKYFGNFKEFVPTQLVSKLLTSNQIKQSNTQKDIESPESKIWKTVGYDLSKVTFYSFENTKYKDQIKLPEDQFGEIVEIWFTRLDPGDMFPLHQDEYLYDQTNLIRYTMLLQDQMPGHVFCYNNKILQGYKMGDVFEFDNPKIWHAAVNVGLTPRLTMQISAKKLKS